MDGVCSELRGGLRIGHLVVAEVSHPVSGDGAPFDGLCEQAVRLAEPMVGGADDLVDEAHVDAGSCEQLRQLLPT